MRIALIGSAPASVARAPYEDKSYFDFTDGLPELTPLPEFINESWEIWACSPGAAGVLRRCTRFFEVHRWEPGQAWFAANYREFLRMFRGPVYIGGPIPKEDIPNQVPYPIERVEAEFSSYFLTSSVALMLAVAILEIEDYRKKNPGYDPHEDVIGLWGIDMAACEEYVEQRWGCQHFILEALRRHIGVYVPPESCLLRPRPIYGLSEWDHNYIKMTARAKEINGRLQQANTEINQKTAEVQGLHGSLENLNYMVNTWTSPYGLPSGQVIRLKDDATLPSTYEDSPSPEQLEELAKSPLIKGNGEDDLVPLQE